MPNTLHPLRRANPRILTINGGSSSIKFALFEPGESLRRILQGGIERIGLPEATLRVKGLNQADNFSRSVTVPDHTVAVGILMDWIEERSGRDAVTAAGHRVVHGGPKYSEPQRITAEMIEELRRLSPFDPEHLPEEILSTEALHRRFPDLPQVACFDTAFHHDLPRVAQLLPIPRHYEAQGVRRYGFHGLSYAFLMEELARLAGTEVAQGRVILAHLGNGASLAAVGDGKPVDTSMSFTPTAGVPMSTRSGDLDPGLLWYLARTEDLDAKRFNEMVNFQSGLLGVSETSSDMRDLLDRETQDVRAAEAVALFCYQVKKWIGAFAAALGGLDTLVFAGGIGEGAPLIRERVCDKLGFLGIELDQECNAKECTADFTGRRSRQGAGHPHRRGAHDRQVHNPRAQSGFNSGNLDHENQHTHARTAAQDGCLLACRHLSVSRLDLSLRQSATQTCVSRKASAATADVCRRYGMSNAALYKWKEKFGGLDLSDARRPKAPEDRNAKQEVQ